MSVIAGRGCPGRSVAAPAAAREALSRATWYVVAACVALLFASPLLFGLLNSLKSPTEAVQAPPATSLATRSWGTTPR